MLGIDRSLKIGRNFVEKPEKDMKIQYWFFFLVMGIQLDYLFMCKKNWLSFDRLKNCDFCKSIKSKFKGSRFEPYESQQVCNQISTTL